MHPWSVEVEEMSHEKRCALTSSKIVAHTPYALLFMNFEPIATTASHLHNEAQTLREMAPTGLPTLTLMLISHFEH
jgi:hypothetical protein